MTAKNILPLFFTTESISTWRASIAEPIAFVPTMGNLHLGHLSLVEEALKLHAIIVVSIFVNPSQFGPNEDLDKYPRTLEQDCQMLNELLDKYPEANLVVFAPKSPSEIYAKDYSTVINPGELATVLEGKSRPGHFQGVCSVVGILLNIVRPTTMYLGKKDYQQLKILQKMVLDLQFNVVIHPVETVRNESGLAMSSRNNFLSQEEIKMAANFPIALKQLKEILMQSWHEHQGWHTEQIPKIIASFCEDSELKWDYCELRQQDFAPITEQSLQVVILGVIKINQVRLLDNLEFNP